MDYQTIRIEKRGQVDWLTLNRPESLNAISIRMVHELDSRDSRRARFVEHRLTPALRAKIVAAYALPGIA